MGEDGDTSGTLSSDSADNASPKVDVAGGESTTAREQAALRRVETVSRLLDDAVRVPGTRFRVGIDPVVGILPGAGDAVIAAISLYPLVEAYRLGVSWGTLVKMLTLVAVDAVVGSIPLIGSVFDAVWKANRWNVALLKREIE
jgi:hypothetical protein